MHRALQLVILAATQWPLAGCLAPGHPLTPRERAVAEAARPILTLDPHAVWTDCYNRLVELGPVSITYLMSQPAMTRPSAPDDLNTLLHASLIRLLANPATAPPLTACAYETTLNLLHFDLKVGRQSVGTVVMLDATPPAAWHELYPAEFDHTLAAGINVEADRRALCAWWRAHRDAPDGALHRRRLTPLPRHLWRLLGRRYADRWQYQPEPRAVRCAVPPRSPTLVDITTYDYNLVRAACIWLGATPVPEVRRQLIELVGSASQVVSHNARFALLYTGDDRIRKAIERYSRRAPGSGRPGQQDGVDGSGLGAPARPGYLQNAGIMGV